MTLSGIGVRFGGLTALDDVSLRVPPGRIVGVIGPNGAGKTTVFNVVCGFVTPHAGTLTLDGSPLRPRPHRLARRGIARTLQGVGLFAGLTLAENVMAGATVTARAGFLSALFALPRSTREEARLRDEAIRQLDALGIGAHADALPATLPYAIQKKAGLARALAARPRLLLLDEPAGGLGADEIDELAVLIRELPETAGTAVLLVEHHMDLVMAVCDEIVVLDFGRVVATGTPDQVRNDPAVAAAYLGTEADPGPAAQADRRPAAQADPGPAAQADRRPAAGPGSRAVVETDAGWKTDSAPRADSRPAPATGSRPEAHPEPVPDAESAGGPAPELPPGGAGAVRR